MKATIFTVNNSRIPSINFEMDLQLWKRFVSFSQTFCEQAIAMRKC